MARFGPYELVRQIAAGGMAEIYLARTTGLGAFEKFVALKMIHPSYESVEQFTTMLIDEAKIAVQLNHRNIVQTFDLGRVDDRFYITMEYVNGVDLYQILQKTSERTIELAFDICAFVGKEIAYGLAYAHTKTDKAGISLGIVHRDVSPPNVLVSLTGEVKLIDFGIAKATTKSWMTATGATPGKYHYMSPEQAGGETVDLRSDIFSAAIVIYEMLTGEMLYFDHDMLKLVAMARAAAIPPPSQVRAGIPPELERIVMRALAKQPADRYQSAAALADDLDRFLSGYAPRFAPAQLAHIVELVSGEPTQVPVVTPHRATVTRQLTIADLVHDKAELHDENSMLSALIPVTPLRPSKPRDLNEPTRPAIAKIPKITRDTQPTTLYDPDTDPMSPPVQAGDHVVFAAPIEVTPAPADRTTEERPPSSRRRTLPGAAAPPEPTPMARMSRNTIQPAPTTGQPEGPTLPRPRRRWSWWSVVLVGVLALVFAMALGYCVAGKALASPESRGSRATHHASARPGSAIAAVAAKNPDQPRPCTTSPANGPKTR